MPTVTSETQLCNLALSRIGNDRQLSSLGEANKPARLCTLMYGPTRDAVLQAHPWNEAIRRVDLAAEADVEPPFEYTYRFPLPSDCLKVIRTEDESAGFEDDYRIESTANGRVLLSNSDTVAIEYIARVEDVALYSPVLVDLIAQRLAAELAPAFADSASMAKNLWDIYAAKLREARSVDAQEGTPRQIVADTWINSRM
jgi:hypothetical protein